MTKKDILTIKKRLLLAYIHGAGADDTTIVEDLESVNKTNKTLLPVRDLKAGDELLENIKNKLNIKDFLLSETINDFINIAMIDLIEHVIDALLDSGLVDVVLMGR